MTTISFPHIGNAYIPLKALVEQLGLEPIVPDRPNRRTIEMGVRHAPEFVCLPFKSTLGDCIDALEKGAEILAMVCGMWACRFGYYGRVQHQILRELGYQFESILIGKDDISSIYQKFKNAVGEKLWRRAASAFIFYRAKAVAVDEWEWAARRLRAREISVGSTDRLLDTFYERLDQASEIKTIRKLRKEAAEALREIPIDKERDPLRVTLLGEVYLVIEPNLNLGIEKLMGELGIEVYPVLTAYRWLLKPLYMDLEVLRTESQARRGAKPFIRYNLGGEEHWTISGTIQATQRGHHGVVHVYPLTCMPENICRTILPRVTEKYNIPLLELCFDEQSSQVGLRTRLEAFTDLLERRRAARRGRPL